MARWCNMITLLAETAPESATDDQGFYNAPETVGRVVFANKRSVGHSEFYESSLAGMKAELKIDVRAMDYHGEKLAELEGKRYSITRDYIFKGGDIVELTLTDIAQHTPEAEEGGAGYGEL